MKFSAAMLKGFKKVNGRQLNDGHGINYKKVNGRQLNDGHGINYRDWPKKPYAACSMGAAILGGWPDGFREPDRFEEVWGIGVIELNDDDLMPWEHIYGMAKAAGL